MPGQYTGIRGQAQAYIPGLITEGLSNAEIVDFLRESGLGYRTQNMYQDVNTIRLEQFGAAEIRNMNIYTPIPERLMREWQGQIDYRYRVVVQYEYTPSDGGELTKTATTLYYDEPPSISNVLEDWDVRTKTLEGGFGSTVNIHRIEGITEINYFVNRPKAGE